MGSIVANLGENVSNQLGTTFATPKITVPFTNILNRAQCVDPSNDLLPRYGLTRVMFGAIEQVFSEIGPGISFAPSGQTVFKIQNDAFDQVRFVGSWLNTGGFNTSNGLMISAPNSQTGEYIEVVFYGTDFNLLVDQGVNVSLSVSIDGGAPTTYSTTPSTCLAGLDAYINLPLTIAKGLSLGVHTIQINCTGIGNSVLTSGYEVGITPATATNLTTVAGTAYSGSSKYIGAAGAQAYNSTFDSGTLGTKGGHVVVYINSNGTITKSVTPTDTTQGNLMTGTPATHVNEEVIKSWSPREFGSSHGYDFATLTVSNGSARIWVHSDNTHALKASASVFSDVINASNTDIITLGSLSDFITFTFVGTGLDLVRSDGSQAGTSDVYSVTIDGTNIGNLSTVSNQQGRIEKIVSGLPFGTHTATFTRTAANTDRVGFKEFITYGPKTPTVPTGSVALCDYFVLAPYVFASTLQSNADQASQGVISKSVLREAKYSNNSWTTTLSTIANRFGVYAATSSIGQGLSYTFWGTGFEWGSSQGSGNENVLVQIDGANYTGAASVNAGNTWTPGTSTLNGGNGTRFSVTGLTLGLHTVTFTWSSGSTLFISEYFDEITPIWNMRYTAPGASMESVLGHIGVGDLRKFSNTQAQAPKAWAQAYGEANNPTTTSTIGSPMPDMTVTIKTSGNPIDIAYSTITDISAAPATEVSHQLYVDGVAVGTPRGIDNNTANYHVNTSDSLIIPVAAGTHVIQLYWWCTSSGTAQAYNNQRNLKVREI